MQSKDGPVLASAVLCVAELCSSMKTYALQSLNKFMPVILKLLKSHCQKAMPDVTVISIVTALQKIVESLGNFLSLYLDKLLFELTRLTSLYTDKEHPKVFAILFLAKITLVCYNQLIIQDIPCDIKKKKNFLANSFFFLFN